jgi:hypothetical protein
MSQPQPSNRPNLDDYVPVHERIAAFYAKFPDGSLQSEVVALTDTLIAMVARAYRNPEDPRPGVGHSSIEVPGRTPYTRGSEMENCETSAWGRAIAALGFEIKRGIATAEEVRNKAQDAPRAPQTAQDARPRPVAVPDASGGDFPWDGLVEGTPIRTTHDAALPDSTPGLSSRDFFDRVDGAGIDRKVVTRTAKQMFGDDKWKVTELTDVQRAALLEELVA